MKEVIEKIIEKLIEMKIVRVEQCHEDYELEVITERDFDDAIEIVNQVAEEYNDRIFINGKCCWQSCACTEKCQECNRYTLSNDDIDWYESIEAWDDEFGKDINVRISNSEIPNMSDDCCEWVRDDYEFDVYDTKCKNRHVFFEGSPIDNEYEYCPYCGKKIIVAPYKPKGENNA